jgi:hypothetical protein
MSVGIGGLVTAYWSMTLSRSDLIVIFSVEWDQSSSPAAPNPSSPYYGKGSNPGLDVTSGAEYGEYHYPTCGGPQYFDLSVTGQVASYLPPVTATSSIKVVPPPC